ncbi:hypothetical protein [Burkholderia gladioli]|uniref:hypothetical protein n=1 Tax=Burkholderia gladioli TaxID=28095 RepID=UPI0016420B07|nr:hypothetical protein [Burkholderia gladioli]
MSDKLSDEQIERAFDSFKCTHPGAAPWYDVPERFLASTVRRLLAASPAPAIPAEPDDEAISAVRARLEQHAVYFSRSSIEEIVSAVRKAAPAISESEDARDAARYRWLRSEHFPTAANPPLAQVVWKASDNRHTSIWANIIDGDDLDRSIDAARKGEKS